MNATASLHLQCPHCRKATIITLGAASIEMTPFARPRAEATGLLGVVPKPSPTGICGCGHDAGWHEGGRGKCTYGKGSPFGVCECDGYHSRRRKTPATDGEAASPEAIASRRCEGLILSCLRSEKHPVSRVRIALRTGYRYDAGGFSNALGSLRGADLIDDVDRGIMLSDAGAKVAPKVPLPSGRDAVVAWKAKFGKCEREILDVLLAEHPSHLTNRSAVAARTASKYSPDAGGFSNALGALRSSGVVVDFHLNPEFFS